MRRRVLHDVSQSESPRHYKVPKLGGGASSGGSSSGGSSSGGGFKVDSPTTPPPHRADTPAGGDAGAASKGPETKPQGAASKGADKALDATAKAGKGTPVGDVAQGAKAIKNFSKTAQEDGGAAAAADVAAAGVRTGLNLTGVGKAVTAALDVVKKFGKFLGIKNTDRFFIYMVIVSALMPLILLAFAAFTIMFLWEHPTQVLTLGFKAFTKAVGLGVNNVIEDGGASRLAYEVPVKDGTAVAASITNPGDLGTPLPGTYAYKLSKIDWEKAKYKTLTSTSNCIIMTDPVASPDGSTRSVINKVVLKDKPSKSLEGAAKANCISSSYPIFNTIMRSAFIRDNLNKNMGIKYAYALPKDSKELDGKTDQEVERTLRNKTLSRIWERSGAGVSGFSGEPPTKPDVQPTCTDPQKKIGCAINTIVNELAYAYKPTPGISDLVIECANNYDYNAPKTIDTAIDKSKHDLECGIPPEQLKFMYRIPTEADLVSADEKRSTAAKVTALKTMCEIYSRTQEDEQTAVDRYKKYVKDRISSEAAAAFQAMTYAHTTRDHFLNIKELGGDAYKIYGMGTAQEYNYSVNDQVIGSPTDSDAVSRMFGLPNARGSVYNDKAVQQAQNILSLLSANGKYTFFDQILRRPKCQEVLEDDSFENVSKLINSPTTDEATLAQFRIAAQQYDVFYPNYKKAVATLDFYSQDKRGGQLNIETAAANVHLEDLLTKLVRIESNASTAGLEEGVQNFNRMGVGIKAYNSALSIAMGGNFLTNNQAVAQENDNRITLNYEDSSKGIIWRLFNNSNPRSFTSRFNVAFIDKPDKIMANVLSVVGNFFNPLKNMVGTPNSLAYALSGKSNVAEAASSYDINNLRIDPAGVPEGFYTVINPIDNAATLETVADNNLQAYGLFTKWDECFKENIPSRFHLLNPEDAKKDLYQKYCLELFDITAPSTLNASEQGIANQIKAGGGVGLNLNAGSATRRTLSFMYRAYHFFNIQADAMVYLSNPEEEDKNYSASIDQAATTTTVPGDTLAPSGASGDTSAIPCPAGTTDGGIATKYGPGKTPEHNLRLCVVQGVTVNVSVASNLNALLTNAKAAQIDLSGWGFRTFDKQVELRTTNKCPNVYTASPGSCGTPTAIPGTSNHENGEAIDFTVGGQTIGGGSKAFAWLKANAATYGFKNLPSESWHWSVDGS